MENLYKFITNPDWWVVFFTAISTIAVIVIAVVQIKLQIQQTRLQKRQAEAQEYEIYKRLYILLSNANNEIDYFLDKLGYALYESHYNADKEYLQRWQTSIDKMLKDLMEGYVDYELKLSKETFDKEGYLNILSIMSRIVQQTIISLQQGDVCLSRGVHSFSFEQGKRDEAFATDIAKHYRGGALPSIMMGVFADFIRLKRTVRCDGSLLESIIAKCKID